MNKINLSFSKKLFLIIFFSLFFICTISSAAPLINTGTSLPSDLYIKDANGNIVPYTAGEETTTTNSQESNDLIPGNLQDAADNLKDAFNQPQKTEEASTLSSPTRSSCPSSSCGVGDITCYVVDFGLCIIQGLATSFMGLGIEILNWSISNESLGLGYTSDPNDNYVIALGWPIVRNLANAALLIGLIIVAINIILGNNEDKAKKDLISFIIIALLINFTPVICSFIINAADIIMKNFLVGLDSQYNATVFGKAVNNSGLTSANQWEKLTNTFFLIIFAIVSFAIYCLYAILFAARKVILWILIIVSPIALVTKVFPQSKYVKKIFPSVLHWDDWSEQFAQWTVIGIPAGLFMYLANQIMAKMSQYGAGGDAEIIGILLANALPIVFLIAGFMITVSAGGQVGSFVGGLGTGAWAATAGKAAAGAKGLGKSAVDRTAGWGMERAGRAKDVAKEGLMGMTAGALSGNMDVFKGGPEGKAAREAGRYQFRETLAKPREAFTKIGLADPNTLNVKSEEQKAAEEKAKGIDLEHYEANKDHYSDIDRIAIEKKLMGDDMGKFLKGAGDNQTEYERRLLSVSKNGDEKTREKALMSAYGKTFDNNVSIDSAEWAKKLKIDQKLKENESLEEYLSKKIKDKDSVGAASKELIGHAVENQYFSPDQYAKIAREGDREKIETVNEKMKTVDPNNIRPDLKGWWAKAGAAKAVYDWGTHFP